MSHERVSSADLLDHAERLVTPPKGPTYSSAPTVTHEDPNAPPEPATLQSELAGGPTLPLRGTTDHAGSPAQSKTAEAVAVAIEVLRRLVQQGEQRDERAQTDPPPSAAEFDALKGRFEIDHAVQKSLVGIVRSWKWQFWALLGFSALNLTGLVLVLLVMIWAAGHLTAVR